MREHVTDFQCRLVAGGYRVTARVDGRAVAGWVTAHVSDPPPHIVASLIEQARRDREHAR